MKLSELMTAEILIVDDEADIRNLIEGILNDEGYKTEQAENAERVFDLIKHKKFSLVILDIWLQNSEYDGLGILERIKSTYPDVPVIMISGHGTIETAVKAIRLGAYEFIEKPFKTDRLLLMVARALEAASLKRENAYLRAQNDTPTEMIGKSHAFQLLTQMIDKVASTNSRVMISGPAGSGKEMVARAIHAKSSRANRPFVILDCSTLSPEKIEEELFGSDKSGQNSVGILERSDGGTLLLDEVGDLSLDMQAKLLRVVQDQSFTHIGGVSQIKVDVRFIASTSRNLEDKVEDGSFREDLFYRLNVVPLSIPPLRDRKDDIPVLIQHFFAQHAEQNKTPVRQISEGAMSAFISYSWPGNIRQLKNLIEWLMITGTTPNNEPIQASDLPPEIAGTIHAALKGDWKTDMIALPLREAREVFEREYLLAQINRFGGNISRTAQFIGMERSALHRKLKLLHISTSDREDQADNPDDYNSKVA
jgi:two-component system nitrogen regulation response regulator NtrX